MTSKTQTDSDSDVESIITVIDVKPRRRNSTGPKYFCKIGDCGASFTRLDHLDRHEYHHTGVKKHACSYDGCDKIYSIVTHLKRHIKATHERTAPLTKDVSCDIDTCDKKFTSVSNMHRHVREVHELPDIYFCNQCNASFPQRRKALRHAIAQHKVDYPHKCAKCAKGFFQQWQYEKHLPKCKIYPCPDCELRFEKWSLYLKHCKEQQHGRKYYKCEHCTRIYRKPSDLAKHTAVKHFDDEHKMVFKCTQEGCERIYSYERNLNQHMRSAHGGKRFTCKEAECERDFSSAQNLNKHIERKHKQSAKDKEVKSVIKQAKKPRKKRKDAGQSVISNLAKLSGLTVDKQFDKLLRVREQNALNTAATLLAQQQEEESEDEELTLAESFAKRSKVMESTKSMNTANNKLDSGKDELKVMEHTIPMDTEQSELDYIVTLALQDDN